VTTSQTTGQNPSSTRQGPTPETYHGAGSPDEISLVDLAKVLWNRRWWMVSIAVGTVVLALLFALSKEHEYRYTTTLRLGEIDVDERVANGDDVKLAVERRFLPALRHSFMAARELQRLPFDLNVEGENTRNLVTLTSETTLENGDLVRAFHQDLAGLVSADHHDKIQLVSRQTEIRLQNLRMRLALQQRRLEDLIALSSEAAALEVEGIADGDDALALNLGAQTSGVGWPNFRPVLSSDDASLTILLSRVQLTDLMTQYETTISDLMRDIEATQLQRNWITPTHVVVEALRSESPVGTGRSLILALGLVLGAMLGLFGAFIAEFGAQVRESLKAPADA
jgi:hypothetical protein